MNDRDLAARLARDAGELLVELQRTTALEGKALGKRGDRLASDFLMRMLARYRPDDGVLCEETLDHPARLSRSRVWIVDPLDGSREYGERRTDWAVHVALAIDGKPTLGAVALPALGEVHVGDVAPPPPVCGRPLRLLVSRSRPSPVAAAVARHLDATLVPMGSAGAKAMAVLRDEGDFYLHSGGQYEWDNCAPAAVAIAAGLHASRIDGMPLRYNNADPLLPDLLICRRELAGPILAALAAQPGACAA